MELNSHTNTFVGGMNLDSDISLLKETQYTYAEDIRLLANENSTTGVLQSRDCLKKIKEEYIPESDVILGTEVTRVYKDGKSRECIVVITENESLNNSIYIIYIKDDLSIDLDAVFRNEPVGWRNKLKIVANYESDTVSKIYVCDGIHHIKIINLMEKYSGLDESSFDISPDCVLNKPAFIQLIAGNLNVGSLQYAYQLFDKHGVETPVSPLSGIINIPSRDGVMSNRDSLGGNANELSNSGCQIKIELDSFKTFDYIRIYRIRYDSNNSIPNIYVVSELPIQDGSVTYNDITDNFINSITVDEFNALTLRTFVAKDIEKHENRLFAANIKENTWDFDFDARAYRCKKGGYIELHHSDETLNISGTLLHDGTISETTVPLTHDCVNPSNEVLFARESFDYMYFPSINEAGDTVYKLGGIGPNITYEFCYTKVKLSDAELLNLIGAGYPSSDFTLTFESKSVSGDIETLTHDNNVVLTTKIPLDSIVLNYSNSWFTANFLGYQRDEIYRFGIIFYDKKGLKTPVHWIGDIRMPVHCLTEDENDKVIPFHFGENNKECTAYSLGIKFTVNQDNLPEEVVSWSIVRCPRTEIDRTIVTQGAISSLILYDTWGEEEDNLGYNDIRPMSLLNCSGKYITHDRDPYSHKIVEDYMEFISPEICVSKLAIEDNLKNCSLCNLIAHSCMQYTPLPGDSPTHAWKTQWGTKQLQIYTLNPELPLAEINDYYGEYEFYEEQSGFVYPSLAHSYGFSGDFEGGALLLKYYRTFSRGLFMALSYNITDAIVSNTLPYRRTKEEVKSYAQAIGNKLYVNTTIGGYYHMNNHGQNAVLLLSQGSSLLHFANDLIPIEDKQLCLIPYTAMDATWVCNIKQKNTPYGGNHYVNRVSSTYIDCVSHKIDDNSVCVYGGDTYLGIFDYAHTTMAQNPDKADDNSTAMFINCYIPLESTINLDLFSSKTYNKLVEKASNSSDTDLGLGLNLIQYEPTVTPNYTQTTPLYEYNSAYSVDGNAQLFVPNLLYVDENPIFETRITSSELKTNNELVDSWTKFKFANYIDVDNQYGPVTNLKSFNGKLFFWLDSAIGVASVNERSLIKDNNISELTLGTGGILVRYDYYSTLNGSVIINDRSICNSVSTLYWYDCAKSEICAINNTVIELSKVKGVKSWCNKLPKDKDAIGWYDWKYNEVLFQHTFDNEQRSLVFNELINAFTGFYMYPVQHVAPLTNKLVTLDAFGHIYLHNADENYENFNPKITFIVNKGYPETKVFDNVLFDAFISNKDVIKDIVFKTKTQETDSISWDSIDIREDTYRFPIGREKNGVSRMRGKYLICDYTFDCTKENDLKIPYIKTTFRISRV